MQGQTLYYYRLRELPGEESSAPLDEKEDWKNRNKRAAQKFSSNIRVHPILMVLAMALGDQLLHPLVLGVASIVVLYAQSIAEIVLLWVAELIKIVGIMVALCLCQMRRFIFILVTILIASASIDIALWAGRITEPVLVPVGDMVFLLSLWVRHNAFRASMHIRRWVHSKKFWWYTVVMILAINWFISYSMEVPTGRVPRNAVTGARTVKVSVK